MKKHCIDKNSLRNNTVWTGSICEVRWMQFTGRQSLTSRRAFISLILFHLISSDLIWPLGKLVDQAIYFTFHNFFILNWDQLSQDLPGQLSQYFHRMKTFLVKLNLFFQFLKGYCHASWTSIKNGFYVFYRFKKTFLPFFQRICQKFVSKSLVLSLSKYLNNFTERSEQ